MNDDGFEITAADWEERSVVNGPGERFVLWLQGCPFRCRGCFNPAFLPFAGGRRVLVAEMAERILSVPGVEGVTYSGGEPMAQRAGRCTASAACCGKAGGRSSATAVIRWKRSANWPTPGRRACWTFSTC